MISLVIYTVAAFGLAYIVGFSKISLPVRNWIDPGVPKIVSFAELFRRFVLSLIECPACFGFWIGFWFAAYVPTPSLFPELKIKFFWMLMLACYTSGSNFILGNATRLITEDE